MAQLIQQPPAGSRDWYAFEAVRAIPRIIQLVDKNPYSRTFGCFDREYWHYRTIDFPCGMSQEFVLALALAHSTPSPGNPFLGNQRLKQICAGSIDFARTSAHADGTCDDYFPFERALGAAVFSLYAMTEAYQVLGLNEPRFLEFFSRRAGWLATHNETGRLSNHQALAALALQNVYALTGEARLKAAVTAYRDLTLSWQHEEGWFQEYEGADPGYHTCTIDFLGKLHQKTNDDTLIAPLTRAVEFASLFMHPDGSYGGEYGSRNTYHFYPHGFELMSRHTPIAGQIAETFLHHAMPRRTRYYNEDNRMLAHYVYDWFQAWTDYNPDRQPLLDTARGEFKRWLPGATMFVVRTPTYHAVTALNKGGVLKAFTPAGPAVSDTGVIGATTSGSTIVTHLVDANAIACDPATGECRSSGVFSRRRTALSSPLRQIAFRILTMTIGRFFPNAIRLLVQKLLITGKPRTSHTFERTIRFQRDAIEIVDRVTQAAQDPIVRLGVGSDATSIYVANSNVFQESTLLPWEDWSDRVPELRRAGTITVTRTLRPGSA